MKFGIRPFSLGGAELNQLWSLPVLLIVLANLIPFAGVLFWGWDVFVLLMLFWLETAVFAFWTMVGVLLGRPDTDAETEKDGIGGRIITVLFFTLHSSLFMIVHFIFLWVMFAGSWRHRIHSPQEFWSQIVIGSGIWLPLLASFVSHGISVIAARRMAPLADAAPVLPDKTKSVQEGFSGAAVGQLYGRVVVLHVAIIVGAFLSEKFGSMAPFLLLILLKTIADVRLHILAQKGGRVPDALPV